MKKLLTKIARLFNPVYSLVYTDAKGLTQMYTITKPRHVNEFGNALKSKKVVFQNQFRKDTFTTNRKGFIVLKLLNIK